MNWLSYVIASSAVPCAIGAHCSGICIFGGVNRL